MSYIEQEKKHTHQGVTYETFLEQSESGLSYWKAWALGIGQLVSIGGYGPVKDFSRKAAVAEAKKKIEADPSMAAKQRAYIEHPGNWSGGKKPKLNPASKRTSARSTAFLVQFDPGYDRASWDRVVAIVKRHAGTLNYGTQIARFSEDSAAQAACAEARAVGVECRRKGGGKHAKRANPWMPGAYAAGQHYLEAEAAKEYQAQLARHLKSGRAKSTMRYVVPEWQQEMVAALGEDDDARFKGLMMQHRMGAISLKPAKKNPNKSSSSYGPVVFANALVYITDEGGTISIRGPVYQSRTSRASGGGYVMPDARRGGDKVFPLAGRDVEVYVDDNRDEPVLQYKGMQKMRGNPAEKRRPGGVTPRSERRKNSWFITYAPAPSVPPSQSPMAQYTPLVNPRPAGAHSSRSAKQARASNPITSPNSSGQGFDPDHAASPYHDTLVRGGYVYSHSTPVRSGQKTWIHHAYTLPGTQMVVGVDSRSWEGHRLGSGAARSGRTTADLAKYLKGVVSREAKSAKRANPRSTWFAYPLMVSAAEKQRHAKGPFASVAEAKRALAAYGERGPWGKLHRAKRNDGQYTGYYVGDSWSIDSVGPEWAF